MNACHAGPFPVFIEDANNEDDKPYITPELPSNTESEGPSDFDLPDEPFEEGWATGLFPEPQYI